MKLDNTPIDHLMPHYTQTRYNEAQTVWIADGYKDSGRYHTIAGVDYVYSDRIWQWDWSKADATRLSIDETLDRCSPLYIQAFLRGFYDNPDIQLIHVMAGVNLGNGYPYQVYGYVIKNNDR